MSRLVNSNGEQVSNGEQGLTNEQVSNGEQGLTNEHVSNGEQGLCAAMEPVHVGKRCPVMRLGGGGSG